MPNDCLNVIEIRGNKKTIRKILKTVKRDIGNTSKWVEGWGLRLV